MDELTKAKEKTTCHDCNKIIRKGEYFFPSLSDYEGIDICKKCIKYCEKCDCIIEDLSSDVCEGRNPGKFRCGPHAVFTPPNKKKPNKKHFKIYLKCELCNKGIKKHQLVTDKQAKEYSIEFAKNRCPECLHNKPYVADKNFTCSDCFDNFPKGKKYYLSGTFQKECMKCIGDDLVLYCDDCGDAINEMAGHYEDPDHFEQLDYPGLEPDILCTVCGDYLEAISKKVDEDDANSVNLPIGEGHDPYDEFGYEYDLPIYLRISYDEDHFSFMVYDNETYPEPRKIYAQSDFSDESSYRDTRITASSKKEFKWLVNYIIDMIKDYKKGESSWIKTYNIHEWSKDGEKYSTELNIYDEGLHITRILERGISQYYILNKIIIAEAYFHKLKESLFQIKKELKI